MLMETFERKKGSRIMPGLFAGETRRRELPLTERGRECLRFIRVPSEGWPTVCALL